MNLGDLVELHILSSNHIRIVSSKSEYHWNILSVGFMYKYRFSASSMDYWLLYPTKNDFLTFELVNLGDLVELHILSMKPHKNCFIKTWISLVSLVCWNILSVGLMYIYVCVLNLWDNVVFYACHCGSQHARWARSSSNFTNSFLHWTPNQSYIYIGILDSIGAVSVGENQTTRRKHMHWIISQRTCTCTLGSHGKPSWFAGVLKALHCIIGVNQEKVGVLWLWGQDSNRRSSQTLSDTGKETDAWLRHAGSKTRREKAVDQRQFWWWCNSNA